MATCLKTLCYTTVWAGLYLVNVNRLARWLRPKWPNRHLPFEPRCQQVPKKNQTGLQVVLPAVGQTGTTTIIDALRMFGLNAYHDADVLLYIPGFTSSLTSPQDVHRMVRDCAIDAIANEPRTDSWYVSYKASVDPKVILTWRDYRSWIRSSANGGHNKDERWSLISGFIFRGTAILPWHYVGEMLTGFHTRCHEDGIPVSGATSNPTLAALFLWYTAARELFGWADTYNRGVYKIAPSEEAYIAFIDEVRREVPPEKLLFFDVRTHGFGELREFLGIPGPPLGTKLPKTRSKDSWTNDDKLAGNPVKAYTVLLIGVAIHIANMVIFWILFQPCIFACRMLLRSFTGKPLETD